MLSSTLANEAATLGIDNRDLIGSFRTESGFRWTSPVGDGHAAFALTILCLRNRNLFPGCLVLQHRHRGNASSAFGKYSNLSGRVKTSDWVLAERYSCGEHPWEQAFRYAASREAYEEAGLDLDERAFSLCDAFTAVIGDKVADCRVFVTDLEFTTLSGSSTVSGMLAWLAERDLRPTSMVDLERIVKAGQANRILAERLSSTFLPLMR